jgi:hypothetical protein
LKDIASMALASRGFFTWDEPGKTGLLIDESAMI